MTTSRFVQVKNLSTAEDLRAHLRDLGVDLAVDDTVDPEGSLAEPVDLGSRRVGNRFAILPMEGWDGTTNGHPTELVERRWRRFGASGAKLIWGGEAVAVRADGRANPNQLLMAPDTADALGSLRAALVTEHQATNDTADDLVVGLQLTHSGRFSRPDGPNVPVIAYHHPLLDRRVGAADTEPLTDGQLDELVEQFVTAAALAASVGFDFVDIKHCHGYLLHELLGAVERPGRYGGAFENRTRFVRSVIEGISAAAPVLIVGVRLSVFDLPPYSPGADGLGETELAPDQSDYRFAFGGDGTGRGIDLDEPVRLLEMLRGLGVSLLCTTAGSPYYNPHVQRPAYFPPSDGYRPPEDPLIGVARQIRATAELKRRCPEMAIVGSAYSYLQDWLAHVAQAVVTAGGADLIGLGRMALSYPELPRDVLRGVPLERRLVCRTFSDCTTAPRNGLVSGCYPLDPFYKARPERVALASAKRRQKSEGVSARSVVR